MAALKRKDVNPVISQFEKNDELVMLINQFRTTVPSPAAMSDKQEDIEGNTDC
jgi:hypothetical protein